MTLRNSILSTSLWFFGVFGVLLAVPVHTVPTVAQAAPVSAIQPAPFSKQYVAALDVARVFGRATGCAEASPELISLVADESIKTGVDSRILASTIAVESACNQYATSSKGAIGLTQVMPKIWKDSYNFERDFNLLNPRDNIHVGASIEAGLIKQYGTENGLHRYNGLGVGCDTCDAGYTDKITSLAARR